MFSIRIGRDKIAVDEGDLFNKLSEHEGSVSVILERPSGMKAVSYVDVSQGVVRQSYGERKVLKAVDFSENGEAFN